MILKNPDKLLKELIPTYDGNIWSVTDVSVTMDENGTEYIFKLCTQVPVKSSPNQQYYHYTRVMEETAKLKFYENTYELYCGGQTYSGYSCDIDTINKFISRLADMLPKY